MQVLWDFDRGVIEEICGDYYLYTDGSKEEYNAMLEKTRSNYLTAEEVFEIAEDIAAHSETAGFSVGAIAECLLNR